MIKDLLLAVFTPSRRLPVFLFLALKLPLGVISAVLYFHLPKLGDSAGGAWLALYLVLLWMSFCLIANRFHDGGMSAIWVFPAYALAAVSFMFYLDPTIVGNDTDVQEAWGERLYFAQRILKLGACVILGLSIKLQSEIGRNNFGMPFGEKDWANKPDLGGKTIASAPQSVKIRRSGTPRAETVAAAEPVFASQPSAGRPRRAGFGKR